MMDARIVYLEQVDSTNTYVREHFDELPDGAFVVTYDQTAGRGRLGRQWFSPAGSNIAGTMVLKHLDDGFHAGCIAGLGGLACVREVAPELCCFLKWPNDLYLEDLKLAGILCEGARFEKGRVTGVAAGIGLNINLTGEELANVGQPAASLLYATGRRFNLDFLTKKLAESMFRYYINYLNNAKSVLSAWREENLLVGETITVVKPDGGVLCGIFEAIAEDGAMRLRTAGDDVIDFRCGDVKIDRNSVDWRRVNHKRKNKSEQHIEKERK